MKQPEFIIDVLADAFIRIIQSTQNQFHIFSSNSLGNVRGVFQKIFTVNSKLKNELMFSLTNFPGLSSFA